MKKILAFFLLALSLSPIFASQVKADSASSTSFELTKTATPATVSPSGTVTFTIAIKNIASSGSSQTPQTVTDTLPDGFIFANDSKLTKLDGTQVDFAPSSVSGQIVTWTFQGEFTEAIPQNQNVVISYSTTAPSTAGSYQNNACLTAPENVCAKATVGVQTTTPQTGLKENIALGLGIAAVSSIVGTFFIRRRRIASFEEAVLDHNC